MSAPLALADTREQTRQPELNQVLIGGLLGNVVVNAVLQAAVLHDLIPPLAIIMVVTVLVAGVCATRWRWAAPLAVLWCVVSVVPGLQPYTYNLLHPAETGTFIATVLGLALLLVATVAGVAEIVIGQRPAAEYRTLGWPREFLVGVAAFSLGASLVATIPPPPATAGVSAEALARLPSLGSERNRFDRTELKARVGETVALRLDNRDAQRHYFDIDELNVHVPMPAGTPALALFRPSTPGTYTFYCQVPGHREAGMMGTLIVEP